MSYFLEIPSPTKVTPQIANGLYSQQCTLLGMPESPPPPRPLYLFSRVVSENKVGGANVLQYTGSESRLQGIESREPPGTHGPI
jgi:hypothetical protein